MFLKDLLEKRRQRRRKLKERRQREYRGFFRENTESLVVSVIMALVVKQFAFEAYKVPTESMEPTIIGRETGGDRIVVNKFVYMMRDPRRWEVVVFRYPLNRAVNYVKRLVGMPGEWLFIRNGDIFTADASLDHMDVEELFSNGQLKTMRKPAYVQDALFARGQIIPPGDRGIDRFEDYWVKTRDSVGRISPRPDEGYAIFRGREGRTLVEFTRPASQRTRRGGAELPVINNRRYDDWSPWTPKMSSLLTMFGTKGPALGTGANPGYDDEHCDIRLELEVTPMERSGMFVVELRDGTHEIPIDLHLAVTGSGQDSSLKVGNDEVPLDVTLESETWSGISMSHTDDRIILKVNGNTVVEHDYRHLPIPAVPVVLAGIEVSKAPIANSAQPTHDLPHENALRFGFDGVRGHVRDIDVARDVYYTYSGATDFRIPNDRYLMFGDNSTNSLDARAWKRNELDVDIDGRTVTLSGDAEGVNDRDTAYIFVQDGQTQHVNRPFHNPFNRETNNISEMTPENSNTFVDDLGNFIEIEPGSAKGPVRTYYDHYVRRDDIMGRAYFTFWPLLQIGVIR